MKRVVLLFLISNVILCSVFADLTFDERQAIRDRGYWYPDNYYEDGILQNKDLAVKIGEAVAREVYGDETTNRFLPYDATEEEQNGEKVWCVKGKPVKYVKNFAYQVYGPIITIRKFDGAILTVRYMN